MRSKLTALIGASESSELIDVKFTVYVVLTLFLCLTDAILTLALLRMGAWEANPIMRAALEMGPKFFILAKYFLTASGLNTEKKPNRWLALYTGTPSRRNRFWSGPPPLT